MSMRADQLTVSIDAVTDLVGLQLPSGQGYPCALSNRRGP
jgi:hypothetical protein